MIGLLRLAPRPPYSPQCSQRLTVLTLSSRAGTRSMMSASAGTARKQHKEDDSIATIFTSLSGEVPDALPPRFSDLKKEIWRDDMLQTWKEVLEELEVATEQVAAHGSEVWISSGRDRPWVAESYFCF